MDGKTPFFRPGGTMEPSAPSYIERAADARLFDALWSREYVFLLDSRQKGKSSLIGRTIVKLRDSGVATVKLDLQRIGANVTPEQWYAGLLSGMGQELNLSKELFAYWAEHQTVGPLARWLGAIEMVVLGGTTAPIVVFVDEVDFVRALNFSTDEFFAAVRDCYNRRSDSPEFARITFCLVGVATPGQLIRNPDITPFNIGTRIELSDFTLGETMKYASLLDSAGRDGEQIIRRVHYWVSGHPYLTQLVCSVLVANPALGVDQVVQQIFLTPEARQREPNLADVERRILEADLPNVSVQERRVQVLELYGQLLRGRRIESKEENPVVSTLRLAGVGLEDGQLLRVRNRLYRTVFDERWRRQNLPEAETQRLRKAVQVAMLRIGLAAGLVVLGVSSAAFGMWRLSNEKERALTRLKRQSEELKQTSGERRDALAALVLRNNEVKRVSAERQRALVKLGNQNAELKRLSKEREQALTDLRGRTQELTYKTYVGQFADVRLEMTQDNRLPRLSTLVEESRTNPNRGWEWGHLALLVSQETRKASFPKWSRAEPQPGGSAFVVTPRELVDVQGGVGRTVQKLTQSDGLTPRFRKGQFRVMMIEKTRGDAIFDATTNKLLVPAKVYSGIRDIDPVRRLYLLARDATLETVELRTIDGDRLVTAFKGPDHNDAAAFLPDGTVLSIHTTSKENVGEVRHWDTSGKTLDLAPSDQQYAAGISVVPKGNLYAAWGFNEKVEIRRVEGHKELSTLEDHPKTVSDLEFSHDGRMVLTGCLDGVMRLFEVSTGRLVQSFAGSQAAISSVAFLGPKGGWMSVDSDGKARIWDRLPKPAVRTFKDQARRVTSATMDKSGQVLATFSNDGMIVSRNLVTGVVVRRSFGTGEILKIASADEDRVLIIGKADGKVELISATTLETLKSCHPFKEKIDVLRVLPSCRRAFVGIAEQRYAILDTSTLKVVARIEPRPLRKAVDANGVNIEDVFTVEREGPQVGIFFGAVGKIQVYSAIDGKLVRQWDPGRAVRSMKFASGGRELIVSLGAAWYVRDGQTMVYDTKSGKLLSEFLHPGRTLRFLDYAPKTGVLGALSSERDPGERTLFLWNLKTREKIAQIMTEPFLTAFSFSPDGERVVTESADNVVRIWNSRTGDELFALPLAGSSKFSADGRHVVQYSAEGGVRIWDSQPWK